MTPKILAAALALALIPTGTEAETAATADPKADLAAIQQRAAADPALQRLFTSLTRSSARSASQRFESMVRYRYLPRGGLKRPMNLKAPIQLRAAEARARGMQMILVADLNGDWQVSLEEIRTALTVRELRGPAEALLTHDENGDGVLSTDEIHAAANAYAARYDRQSANPLALFDFNGDGMLTPEEYKRGLAALDG